MPGKAMLRQVLRGAAGAAGPVRGRLGPNVGRRPAVGAGRAAAIGGGGGYPPTVAAGAAGTMPARRTLAAAAADGGRGKGGAKEDKAATGGAAAAAKLNALTMAIKRIEHLHGKGSLMRFGDKNAQFPQVEVISTGSLALDHALGTGGLPRGRVVEMYGPESSGKTTVALHVIAEAQKMGGTCVFIDAEHALDPGYARRLGVDVDNLYISQPDNGEQGLDIAETLIKSGTVDCVVVDSVAALVPKAELDGDIGDHHIALQARLMSQALRKLTGTISKTKCLLIFINQIRQKVGVIFGSNEVTTGGTALRFYSSVRLEIRRGQKLRADGEDVGARTKVKVVKNKLAPPFAVAEFDMLFGSGVDRRGEVLDLGVQLGLVAKSGAWFSLGELAPASLRGGEGEEAGDGEEAAEAAAAVKAVGEWPLMMGQGREKSKAFLEEHPGIYKALARAVRAKLRTMEPYAAHASSTFHEEEEEEEKKKKKKKTAAAAGASAAAEEEDDLEHENAREGAFASPTPVEEEGAPAAEEDGKKAGKGKRRTRGASASKGATVAAAEAVVPEPTPVEHFGMGAGGGVDLEIDYVSGDVRNEAALKQAAAAEGGAASS